MVINKLGIKVHQCMYSLHNIKVIKQISVQGKGIKTKTKTPACPNI